MFYLKNKKQKKIGGKKLYMPTLCFIVIARDVVENPTPGSSRMMSRDSFHRRLDVTYVNVTLNVRSFLSFRRLFHQLDRSTRGKGGKWFLPARRGD